MSKSEPTLITPVGRDGQLAIGGEIVAADPALAFSSLNRIFSRAKVAYVSDKKGGSTKISLYSGVRLLQDARTDGIKLREISSNDVLLRGRVVTSSDRVFPAGTLLLRDTDRRLGEDVWYALAPNEQDEQNIVRVCVEPGVNGGRVDWHEYPAVSDYLTVDLKKHFMTQWPDNTSRRAHEDDIQIMSKLMKTQSRHSPKYVPKRDR